MRNRFPLTIVGCAFVTALALLCGNVRPLAAEHLTGNQIYSLAIEKMRSLPLPKRMRYNISVVRNGLRVIIYTKVKTDRFVGAAVALEHTSGRKHTFVVNYNSATGMGIATSRAGHVVLKARPFPYAPVVAALYNTSIPSSTPSPSPSPSSGTNPLDLFKVITRVYAFSPGAYNVRNLGVETCDSQPAYHLGFTARDGNESAHPVTDALIDTRTFRLCSVTLGGGKRGFIEGGGGQGVFTFANASGYWVVKRISVLASGHLLFIHQAGSVVYTLNNFSFSN